MQRKRLFLGVGILVAVVLVVSVYLYGYKEKVVTAEAQKRELVMTVRGEGVVRARDAAVLYAAVAGKLERVAVEAGDRVKKDDILAVYDLSPFSAEVDRCRAELDAAEAELASRRKESDAAVAAARLELQRSQDYLSKMEKLYQQNAVSQEELARARQARDLALQEVRRAEALQQGVKAMEARVEAARAALDLAEDRLRQATVKARRDGVVLAVPVEKGMVVSPGAHLFTVGDPTKLEIEAEFSPSEAGGIRTGQEVRVYHLAGGPVVATGRVTEVNPTGRTSVSTLGVKETKAVAKIVLDEIRGHLKPGYEVNVDIVTQTPQVLVIPESAVFTRDDEPHVYIVVQGHARLRAIKTGRAAGGYIEVEDGLSAGDRVVIEPGERLRDGVAVKIVD
ncbi:MAG: efflux RND transporter periplasmic adaptor subunit [Peptococcaceae bacterium]|nr:efflux RND transporter periplasmic adaptor subunit [Peptococcaceae bacterium]